MSRLPAVCLAVPLLAASCAYEAPLDEGATPAAASISGTVVIAGAEAAADTMVLVYAASAPPPPYGTGSPLTFSTVPASDYTEAAGGLLEADFQVTLADVPDGDVLVTALVDVDGDFYPLPPFATVLGGATCGDWSGAHVSDLESLEFAPVSVAENIRVDGITVVVGREAVFERPAFVMQGGSPIVSRAEAALGATQTFRLASTGIAATLPASDGSDVPLLDLAGPFDGTDPCGTSFWVTVYDRDGDGQPDPHPVLGAAAMDAYPQVLVQYLGAVDEDGVVTPPDPSEGTWAGYLALLPDVVWFGEVPLNTPTPLVETEWVWVPVASNSLPNGTSNTIVDPTQLPAGAWSVTVVNVAGQTWTLPNALAGLGSSDPAYQPASQAGVLLVE